MQSESIKRIVGLANALVDTGDRKFDTDNARNLASTIMAGLTRDFRQSPTFAAAIVQHIVDEGFDIRRVRGTAYAEFSTEFGGKMARMDAAQITQIRAISANMFGQRSTAA